MVQPRHTAVSLFTGAGGLDAGLEATGRFDLRAAVDNDAEACKGLEANRDNGLLGSSSTRILCEDLSSFAPQQLVDEVPEIADGLDLLLGGPPCQAFSTAGRRRGVTDPRGQLIWTFLDYVVALQPRYFLMENVRGLLSAAIRHRPLKDRPARGGPPLAPDEEPGSLIALWARDLAERSGGTYRVDVFEVNAVNYGAPQLRERVLFVGNRLGERVDFPQPTHHDPRAIAAGTAPKDAAPFATLADALAGLERPLDDDVMDFSPRKKHYLSMVPEGGNWRTLPEAVQRESMGRAWHAKGGRSGWWRRLSWDLPCPTLTTIPSHASTSMCHPAEVRALSAAEYAAIQEFPPGWEVYGDTASKYRQLGNAVPTRLARVAGDVVADALDHGAPTAGPDDPPLRRRYLRSHVRTRTWYAGGQAVVRSGAAAADA